MSYDVEICHALQTLGGSKDLFKGGDVVRYFVTTDATDGATYLFLDTGLGSPGFRIRISTRVMDEINKLWRKKS